MRRSQRGGAVGLKAPRRVRRLPPALARYGDCRANGSGRAPQSERPDFVAGTGARFVAHLIGSLHLRLRRRRALAVLLVFAAAVMGLGVGGRSAFSQVGNPNELVFPIRPKQNVPPPPPGDAPMLVEATEIKYDYSNNIVAAVGNVQIYYKGFDHRGRSGHLRPESKAPASRRQCQAHAAGRQYHLRADYRSYR